MNFSFLSLTPQNQTQSPEIQQFIVQSVISKAADTPNNRKRQRKDGGQGSWKKINTELRTKIAMLRANNRYWTCPVLSVPRNKVVIIQEPFLPH